MQMKEYKLYRFISLVFSPPLVAAAEVLILAPFSKNIFGSLILGLAFLTIYPILAIYRKYLKGETDLDVSDRKDRPKIYSMALASFAACTFLFWLVGDKLMLAVSLSYLFVTAVMVLINAFTKISAHTTGLAGPITAIVFYFGIFYSGLYLLLFPVAYARFKLGAHNRFQLFAGAIIGTVLTYTIFAVVM